LRAAYSAAICAGARPDGMAISWAAASAAASAAVCARDFASSAASRSTETRQSTPATNTSPAVRTVTDPRSLWPPLACVIETHGRARTGPLTPSPVASWRSP
jgi:hypothetical protein